MAANMEQSVSFHRFYEVIVGDGRIGPVHISMYMALLHLWKVQGSVNPINIFSRELMPVAKISGIATYYRVLKELTAYGYIRYVSTYDRVVGSLVYMLDLEVPQRGE